LTNILKLLSGKNLTPMFPDDDTELAHITDRIAHLREYTACELKELIIKAGFDIVEFKTSLAHDKIKIAKTSNWKRRLIKLTLLPFLILAPPFRGTLVFLARKRA